MIEQILQMEFGAVRFRGRSVLCVAEVAQKLHITEHQVRNLIEVGKLGAINIGSNERKHWRIPVDEYERFLRANATLGAKNFSE